MDPPNGAVLNKVKSPGLIAEGCQDPISGLPRGGGAIRPSGLVPRTRGSRGWPEGFSSVGSTVHLHLLQVCFPFSFCVPLVPDG